MRFLALSIMAVLTMAAAGPQGDRIRGAWKVTAYDQDGRPMPAELLKKRSASVRTGSSSARR
jgi:hypothetical protein